MSGPAAARPRRIGILGGSFDPPHLGHLHAARAALEAFGLDEVRLVPAARPPHKPGRRLAEGRHRVALLELLAAGEPWLRVDARELSRSGPSYTVDTLRELAAEEPGELYLILGTDNLPGLPEWREVGAVLTLARPVVVQREDEPARVLRSVEGRLPPELVERLRAGLLTLPPVEASSTGVRAALAEGEAPGEELPPALEAYVREHGLYGEGDA
jgi:nicotinate-nucleotide adenylyltransferase